MIAGISRRIALALAVFCLSSPLLAAEKSYKDTTIWNVSMISVEPGQDDAYLDSLKGYYTTVMEEAIRQKLILSYKILVGNRANPSDFNVMILTEGPNWASLDGLDAKFDAIAAKFAGSADKATEMDKKTMTDRAKIRTIFGSKMMQQVEFKK